MRVAELDDRVYIAGGWYIWSYTACACVTSALSTACVWKNKGIFSRLLNSAFFWWQQVRRIGHRVLHDCLYTRKSFMWNIFQFVPKSFCEHWSREKNWIVMNWQIEYQAANATGPIKYVCECVWRIYLFITYQQISLFANIHKLQCASSFPIGHWL